MDIYEVQAKENDRQRRNEKVLDTFSNKYRKGLIGSEMCVDGLLYGLDIVIVSQQMQVGLEGTRHRIYLEGVKVF
jgi:hypothetical protein